MTTLEALDEIIDALNRMLVGASPMAEHLRIMDAAAAGDAWARDNLAGDPLARAPMVAVRVTVEQLIGAWPAESIPDAARLSELLGIMRGMRVLMRGGGRA